MSAPNQFITEKRTGITGIFLGFLALLACELPIILAVLGFSGLSAAALPFKPPPWVEIIAVVLSILGAGLLILRARKRRKNKRPET